MRHRSTFAFASMAFAVSLAMEIGDLRAQTSGDSDWLKQAIPRLQAIYERGEFRPATFRAEWLPDSSGYSVQERNSQTNQMAAVNYDVRTGERSESTDVAK